MNRTRDAIIMGIGILAGIALSGPAAHAATAAITAEPSSQPIYVDGARVEMEAYGIHGNNFVKLRDIGEAVGFNVYWDGSAVQIESDKPYTGEPPASQTAQPEQAPAPRWKVHHQRGPLEPGGLLPTGQPRRIHRRL